MAELEAGTTMERTYSVTRALTAAALAEGDPTGLTLPAVWSTPDMIARMEIVSAALVAPHLAPGQMTVGARNEVSHIAATPTGMTVRVRSTLNQVEGRKLTFAVEAFDEKEKVGDGVHIRYIVECAKFDSRLAEKSK
jgi:predicted thioesterase